MSKRQHPVAQVLRLIASLTDDQKAIVRDFLKQPRSKSSSPAPVAGKRSSLKKVDAPSSGTLAGTAISASGD